MSTYGFVGDLLIRTGVVDAPGLLRALEVQSSGKLTTLGRALAQLALADESVVASTIATALRLECIDSEPEPIVQEIAALLPADFCRRRGVVPLALHGNRLRLAVRDPLNYSVLQDVEFRTGKKTVAVVATETWVEKALRLIYPEGRSLSSDMLADTGATGEVEAADGDYDLVDPAALAKDAKLPPIVRLVNLILSDAAKSGASEVHIEPQETCLQVRQRVDGLLRDVQTIPHDLKDQAISRLKIISGMDISERRKPQDGRSRLRFDGRRIDLRVSSLPTQLGEKIVILLLNSDQAVDQPQPAPLPAPAAQSSQVVELHARRGASSDPVAVVDPPPPMGRRRVLIVEDSPTIVSVVKYFLELDGFDVLVAEDGRAGLDMALRELPDVIVTDVNMPLMGGMEMVKHLRADARTAAVRILMLTSDGSVESETQGLEAGADDYILKPVEPRRLAARVKGLLGRLKPRAA